MSDEFQQLINDIEVERRKEIERQIEALAKHLEQHERIMFPERFLNEDFKKDIKTVLSEE